MDNLGIAKLLAEKCWLVVWKDPTEGDRSLMKLKKAVKFTYQKAVF